MFCGNCGAKNIEGDVFCTSCGERMEQSGGSTASSAPPPLPSPKSEPAPTQAQTPSPEPTTSPTATSSPVPTPPPVPPPVSKQVYQQPKPTYQASTQNNVAGRASGEIILTVMGILIIIAAVSSFFSAITGFQGVGGGIRATLIINLLTAPYLCYMGIAGLRYCKDSEKVQMLQMLGGIAIAIAVISMIVSLATIGAGTLSGAVVALLRPAMLIYGARMNQ